MPGPPNEAALAEQRTGGGGKPEPAAAYPGLVAQISGQREAVSGIGGRDGGEAGEG